MAQKHAGGFAKKLSLAFALVVVATAILLLIVSFVTWNYQFNKYVKENLDMSARNVAAVAAQGYAEYNGWDFFKYNVIPRVQANNDIMLQILDTNDQIIYDDATMRAHEEAKRAQMLAGAGVDPDHISNSSTDKLLNNMNQTEAPLDNPLAVLVQPTSNVVKSPIIVNEEIVGYVRMWAVGEGGLLSARDQALRNTSIWTLILAAIFSAIIALMAGRFYAKTLVKPINKITETALALREGNIEARTGFEGDDEIDQLGEMFDRMADKIESDRELERRLTSDVAHELRTPLMGILATVECIEDGIYPADAEHLGVITTEVGRLQRLTDVILELSRMETGALPFHMDTLDISIPVKHALDIHSPRLEVDDLHLAAHIKEGILVHGDNERLQQAVGNLLSNAARYTPTGGNVNISCYERDGMAVIEVADTGIGISKENLENTFKRFWRADEARHRATGGIGIGLSITKEIVERHHGYIEVDSEENVGTTFKIIIPLTNV